MSHPVPTRFDWELAELPEPPPYSFRNFIKLVGPGVILLATSIGGGEWLVGPATAVQHGHKIMWIATVAIVLQVIFNIEALRYTLYTGEPVYGGILRLAPGRRFWAVFYCLLTFLQLGWPALAGSTAVTLFAAQTGRLAVDADSGVIYMVATGLIVVTFLILSFGGTVEKTLERASYFMMAFVFVFLLAVNIWFIPLAHWWKTFAGFFQFTGFGGVTDWSLLAALAATAGSGGMGNLCVTSWARDKGLGMAKHVGAIPGAVGGRHLKLSPVGKVFEITPESLRRWKIWQQYIHVDQVLIWGLLAFVGMYLNVNLATGVIPPGTELKGMAMGAFQAKYMAEALWSGLWFVTLLNGFWILYSTHLGNTDILVRVISDILWMSSPKVRDWLSSNIRRLYYGLLILFTAWAIFAVRWKQPFDQFKLLANVAGFVIVIAGIQIVLVNRKFLPRELRVPWREFMLVLCSLFYLFFTAMVVFG